MFTVMLVLGAAIAIDQALAASAKLAMKRADLTLDYVSRVTGVPVQRLSDQLNGKTPFTSFWRFFTGEMRETAWLDEWVSIAADSIERTLLPRGVRVLVIPDLPKRMAKADLRINQKEQAS